MDMWKLKAIDGSSNFKGQKGGYLCEGVSWIPGRHCAGSGYAVFCIQISNPHESERIC